MPFRPLSCVFGKFYIPQFVIIPIMLHLALWNSYHFRVVVNIAMAEMKAPMNETGLVDACPMYQNEEVKNLKGGRFQWSNNQETGILAGFYVGYIFSHMPGGWLADKLGPRHVLGACILGSALLTFLYPLAVETEIYAVAIVMRILVGIFQGPLFPCFSAFIQAWVPDTYRSVLGTIAYTGSTLGSITGYILTGTMIQHGGSWKLPFYVWPGPGIIWYIFFLFIVFSYPESHPFITEEERKYLESKVPKKRKFKSPWKAILTSIVTYALIAAQFGHDYILYSISTLLPKYMKDILKESIQRNAIYNAIPFLCIWISSLGSSAVADYVIYHKLLSVLNVRRIWTAVSAIVPGILLVIVTYVGCNRLAAIILYSVVMFFKGLFFSGMKVNVNDITKYHGGVLMAVTNGLGALAGVVGPAIAGALTTTHSLDEWKIVMWITLGVMCVTTLIYWIFTSTERQPWDYTAEELEEMNSN